MGVSPLVLIVIGLLVVGLIIWILRSRGGGSEVGHHVDTSVTAVGAATEAVRNVVEEVAETIEEALATDVAASGAKTGDAGAAMSNTAALTATGGAATGGTTFTEIGVPAAIGAPDNLRLIKGLGPKLNGVLADLGITRYDQIAAWTEADVAKVDAHLGTFKGRIVRDNWIEQAKYLASDDAAGFEAKFGKLDKSSRA